MNVLLLDDEPGIREGLAAVLRRKGHRVRAADSLAAGMEHLAEESFDVVVSDWRLPDGVAADLLAGAPCPVVVVSGQPDEVRGGRNLWQVMAKPVLPQKLVELLARLEERAGETGGKGHGNASGDNAGGPTSEEPAHDAISRLPADCRRLLRAAINLLSPESFEIEDDGSYVVLHAPLPEGGDSRLRLLENLGGDLRVLAPADGQAPRVELRVFRDARPREGMPVVAPLGPWPQDAEFAVDLDLEDVPPQVFLELLKRATRAADDGRRVHFLNVPGHLRFFAEVSGRGHDMPIREKAGPHLPDVLTSLWS